MKRLLSIALVFVLALALAIPALAVTASAAPASAGFINGAVASIDKKSYDNFDGKEITANNNTVVFDNFSFIADNKTLNALYINVTGDISGTLEVAYKIGNGYYVVTFAIDGPGKYWIADSKGGNSANVVKVGVFAETEVSKLLIMNIFALWGSSDNFDGMTEDEKWDLLYEIYDSGAFDFVMYLTNGYGEVFGARSVCIPFAEGETVEFNIDPISGTFEYDGYIYTWWLDQFYGTAGIELNDDGDGVSFSADPAAYYKGADGIWYYEVELLFGFAIEREQIVQPKTYFLEIYAPGSIWGEWTAYLESGGSMVFDQYDPDEYYFVVVCEEEYGEQVAGPVYFWVNQDHFEFSDNNLWFDFDWDGGNVLIITFNLD
ncbi:MAG: hypothetical protein LBE48_01675 [Methanomassiliicoccaceae archaeon]|jgi:hypothetical protein|nr:hypothetical protein [Methanomassiliicoccaceae archaeon]